MKFLPSKAHNYFATLTNLLESLGLPINHKKVEEPHYEITCLGININARSGRLTIADNKICKIKCLIAHWLTKKSATRHQLQKLVGNLLHIYRCVKPARLFTNRILQKHFVKLLLRAIFNYLIPFLKILTGLATFLRFSMVRLKSTLYLLPLYELYVDSCLTGMGAFYQGKECAISIHSSLLNVHNTSGGCQCVGCIKMLG